MTPEGGNATSLQDQADVESKLEARGLNETTELFFLKRKLTSLVVLPVFLKLFTFLISIPTTCM